MDSKLVKLTENSDSGFRSTSKLTESTARKEEELEQTLRSLSTLYDAPKKSHDELRNEKINELNLEYQTYLLDEDYEKGITIMKKLIFFEPSSNIKI